MAQVDWRGHERRERERFLDGEARLPGDDDPDARQKQLTRMGNAAAGAGLSLLMQRRPEDAAEWLRRASDCYRSSFDDAPPGSWGRPIGVLKADLLRGDWGEAKIDAQWALEVGAADAESPIGRYAAALAHLVLGDDEQARVHADAIRTRDDFPREVADALAFIAAADVLGYTEAIEAVLESFEQRDDYLEDIPVADTVLVLQSLAGARGLEAPLSSPLLPGD